MGGGGTQTSALASGGESATANLAVCEAYNGTSWTEVADLNTARYGQGIGASSTSSLHISGSGTAIPVDCEEFDGSSWTEVGNVNTARYLAGVSGTTNSGIVFGGDNPTPGYLTANEYWNGSSWTELADLNTARRNMASTGQVYTAALAASGRASPGNVGNVESWNGSAWTETTNVNTTRRGAGGSGTSTDGLIFGQTDPAYGTQTENWNGTAWTEVNDMSTGRGEGTTRHTMSTASSAIMSGGRAPSRSTATEEFSFPSAPAVQEGQLWIKTATNTNSVMKGYQAQGTGAWATGGALNTARESWRFKYGKIWYRWNRNSNCSNWIWRCNTSW
jgi:hypothetical protein